MKKKIKKNRKNRNTLKRLSIFLLCEIISIHLLIYSCVEYRHVELDECQKITGTILDVFPVKRHSILVNVSGKKAYLVPVSGLTNNRNVYVDLKKSAGKEIVTMFVRNGNKNVFGINEKYPQITEIRSNDDVYLSIDEYNAEGFIQRTLAIVFFVIFQIIVLIFYLFWKGVFF